MADDGMLLNFDIGNGVLAAKPSFKGGRWKDRLSAKRNIGRVKKTNEVPGGRQDASQRTARVSGHSDADTGARDVKRQKLDSNSRPTEASALATREPMKQVISSLFTYNPQTTTKATPQSLEETPIEPSNAPLSSELDTFTSLGLTPEIASHMLSKMGLKAPTAIQKAAITQLLKEDSDAFIQAETGSGKTLAYLLPIVQRIMEISKAMKESSGDGKDSISRKSGLFAIILAPTRELSKQIQVVLDSLLRCAHWIVSGIVIGGEKKQSEKARLRKGVNILVATPGRLADHLQNTEVLDVSNVRWLVLDEGDRLMELGFENDIQKIVGVLNLRLKAAAEKNKVPGLPAKRTTVLCSATLKVDVQRLGEISLKEAVHIQKDPGEKDGDASKERGDGKQEEFSAPAQLKQSYAVVPAKLRLVSLIAYLKRAFERRGSVMKAIVFISCADSVDFHFDLLTKLIDPPRKPDVKEVSKIEDAKDDGDTKSSDDEKPDEGESDSPKKELTVPKSKPSKFTSKFRKQEAASSITSATSAVLSSKENEVTAYKLHGSLTQALRTSTVMRFSKSIKPSVLLATDVASRGLDVPNVDIVLEYDPAFSRDDHIHRIGRTARAGRDGRACVFLMPGCEEKYIDILSRDRRDTEGSSHLLRQTYEEVLKRGLGSNKPQTPKARGQTEAWDAKATELQLDVERWIDDAEHPLRKEAAKKGWQGHIRAYMTHVAAERHCFDIKELHLGHVAKAFGLREPPGGLGGLARRAGAGAATGKKAKRTINNTNAATGEKRSRAEVDESAGPDDAVRKMRDKIKKQKMMGMGVDEFNLG